MELQETQDRDRFGRRLEDRGAWRQATTLAGAGELTARWLEGNSEFQPATFTATYDAETAAIAVELAALNRNGPVHEGVPAWAAVCRRFPAAVRHGVL
jgi:hypothetical protein